MSIEPLRFLISSAASILLVLAAAVTLLRECTRLVTVACKLATVLSSSAIVAASAIGSSGCDALV